MRYLHLLLPPFPERSRALLRLAARGTAGAAAHAGLNAALDTLFETLGALAPLMLASEGKTPGEAAWFRADPVHLLAGMHSVSLFDCRRFRIGSDEAEALIAALNAHFGEQAHFTAPHPERWYVRFGQAIDAAAPPLDEAAGNPIEPHLVTGPDAALLHRFAMEAQMLLHALPINEARTERGELPINGLWFWGGGIGRKPAAGFDRVQADDFTAQALAEAAGIERTALPQNFEPLPGRTLAVLDTMRPPASLDADWFEPILAALQWGKLDLLALEVTGSDGLCAQLDQAGSWRVWRN